MQSDFSEITEANKSAGCVVMVLRQAARLNIKHIFVLQKEAQKFEMNYISITASY